MKISFHGKNDNGKITLDDPKCFRAHAETLGRRVTLTLGNYFKGRSLDENSYYWGVVVKMIADDQGENPMKIHVLLKKMFLVNIVWMKLKGEMKEIHDVQSSAEISTVRFEQFMEDVRAWAQDFLNLTIPLPDPEKKT